MQTAIVLNAAGQWAPRLSAMVGALTPMVPIMHQYLTTRHIPGHELPEQTPVVRDPDNLFYLREEVGGFLVGGFELEPKTWAAGGVAWDFTQQLLPEDWELFEPVMEGALRRIPLIEQAEVIKLINGPDAMTPDGHYCLGPVPGVPGFFVAAGMSLNGIAGAGGVGKVMAEWIIDGEPSLDLYEMNIRRFGANYGNTNFVAEKAREVYHYYYHQHYPADETLWARKPPQKPAVRPACRTRRGVWREKRLGTRQLFPPRRAQPPSGRRPAPVGLGPRAVSRSHPRRMPRRPRACRAVRHDFLRQIRGQRPRRA